MIAFAEFINSILTGDKDLEGIIPVSTEKNELFAAVASGVVLCKLINLTQASQVSFTQKSNKIYANMDEMYAQM